MKRWNWPQKFFFVLAISTHPLTIRKIKTRITDSSFKRQPKICQSTNNNNHRLLWLHIWCNNNNNKKRIYHPGRKESWSLSLSLFSSMFHSFILEKNISGIILFNWWGFSLSSPLLLSFDAFHLIYYYGCIMLLAGKKRRW